MNNVTPIVLFCVACLATGCTKKSTDAAPGKITGVVTLSPELRKNLKPDDVLFVVARGRPPGPPSAVKRWVNPQFPVKYVLGPEDAVVPGSPGFEAGGELNVTARVSRGGKALPSAGDLEGAYEKNPAHPGDAGVDVTINRERP